MAKDKDVSHNVVIPFYYSSHTAEVEGPRLPNDSEWYGGTYKYGDQSYIGRIQCSGYSGNFADKLSKSPGGLVTGAMSVDLTEVRFRRGSFKRGLKGPLPKSTSYHARDDKGIWFTTIPVAPISETDVQSLLSYTLSKASIRLASKYNKQRELLLGAMAVEAGKSAMLCAEYVRQASDLFRGSSVRVERRIIFLDRSLKAAQRRSRNPRQFRREATRLIKRALDNITEEWIKLNFGLKPLVDDLLGLAQAASKFGKSDRTNKVLFAVEKTSISTVATSSITEYNRVGGRYNVIRKKTASVTVKLRAMLKTNPATQAVDDRRLGVTRRDIVATIHELIPWSWLLDYVSNAGKVIDTWATLWHQISATQVTKVIEETDEVSVSDASYVPYPGYSVMYHTFVPGQKTTTRTRISRSVSDGVPLPSFHWENNLGDYKLSMVASVAWQQLVARRLKVLTSRLIAAG